MLKNQVIIVREKKRGVGKTGKYDSATEWEVYNSFSVFYYFSCVKHVEKCTVDLENNL